MDLLWDDREGNCCRQLVPVEENSLNIGFEAALKLLLCQSIKRHLFRQQRVKLCLHKLGIPLPGGRRIRILLLFWELELASTSHELTLALILELIEFFLLAELALNLLSTMLGTLAT